MAVSNGWPVEGPPPIPQVHGLFAAAGAPAAGVRFVIDTDEGPLVVNVAGEVQGYPGLYRLDDGTIVMRYEGGAERRIYVPARAGRERWLNGVAVYPYPAEVPIAWEACSNASPPTTKPFGENITPPEFSAIVLVQPITCTAQQIPNQQAFKARATLALAAKESYAAAKELMGGALLGSQPFLADGQGTFPNDDTATGRNHGLQILEKAIADTGSLGVIHCSPMLATALMGGGFVLDDKSGVIRTINGTVVVADYGYADGATPNGHAAPGATQEWAYATGPIDIRRSEIFTTPDNVSEALDRSLGATNDQPNSITYRAERYVVTDWDTALQAAVLIDRCSTDCNVSAS